MSFSETFPVISTSTKGQVSCQADSGAYNRYSQAKRLPFGPRTSPGLPPSAGVPLHTEPGSWISPAQKSRDPKRSIAMMRVCRLQLSADQCILILNDIIRSDLVFENFCNFLMTLARKMSQRGTKNHRITKTLRKWTGMRLICAQLNFQLNRAKTHEIIADHWRLHLLQISGRFQVWIMQQRQPQRCSDFL